MDQQAAEMHRCPQDVIGFRQGGVCGSCLLDPRVKLLRRPGKRVEMIEQRIGTLGILEWCGRRVLWRVSGHGGGHVADS